MRDKGQWQSTHRGVATEIDLHGLFLVVVASTWLIGIFLASLFPISPLTLLISAAIAMICAALFWHDHQARLILLLIIGTTLGAWRYTIALPSNDPQAISTFIGTGPVSIQGAVADEPTFTGRGRSLLIAVSSVSRDNGNSWQDAHGQIGVQMLGSSIETPYGPNYGDAVELQGRLQPPLSHSPLSTFASMAFPRVSVISSGGNPLIALFYHWRVALANILAQSLPQPEAAILIAILLGLHTPDLNLLAAAFSVSGTAHLIVSSGFKVTILAGLVSKSTPWLYNQKARSLLPAQKYKNWRHWSSMGLVVICIAIYTIMSGAGPAAIRAGVMGSLLVIAPRLGRTYNIFTALAIAALLMSIADPFVLWSAGFQLSFLGTLGIVLLTPFFQNMLHPLARFPFGHFITEIIAVTLAAQVATLPIFAITFQEISFIAPITNLLTVPLLAILITLGAITCGAGLLFHPAALLCGWIVWPLLWYIKNVVVWCANLPGAYITVSNLDQLLAWGYYAGLIVLLLSLRHVASRSSSSTLLIDTSQRTPFRLSRRATFLLQISAALLLMAATGLTAIAAPLNGQLIVRFLSVGPQGQAAQGEAVLVRTPDNKTLLIDGGLEAASLSQAVDSLLPPWQRSLDVVLLTNPKQDHIVGLQEVLGRYAIGEVIDAGMLHPSATYALWRRTINELALPYVPATQGMTIAIGKQVALQVLWPTFPLHQGSHENNDNSLVFRLIAPGIRILLLGEAAQSSYALQGLLTEIDPRYLQADIVQVVEEISQPFPTELNTILQRVHPLSLVVTPGTISSRKRKAGALGNLVSPLLLLSIPSSCQVVQTAQAGTIEVSSNTDGWNMNTL